MNQQKPLKLKKSPIITLKGNKIKTYVDIVTRLIKGGRPNKFFPDMKSVCNLIKFLVPENSYGMYKSLDINYDTGLPAEQGVTKVIVDKSVAPKTVKEDSERALRDRVEKNPSEVNKRRLSRYLYHKDLLEHDLPPLMQVKLKLRKVDTEKYIAFFNAEVVRFELTGNLFTKYTLIIGQEDPKWNESLDVQLAGDNLRYTQNFRNLISKYTVHESEFTFVLLNELSNVNVEEVQRCRIGPLYFNGVNVPQGMENIFSKYPNAFILSLPSDRTSVHIKGDKNMDPLVTMYRDVLEPDSRKIVQKKAESMGYHVYKERKFVCTKNVLKDFREFLRKRGARCVVYGV